MSDDQFFTLDGQPALRVERVYPDPILHGPFRLMFGSIVGLRPPPGRRKVAALIAAAVLVTSWAGPAWAGADTARPSAPPYPVPYSALVAGLNVALRPGAPPAGANDWGCRPSPAHPRPVVLVHGLGANMAANWDTISPALANEGFCVFALTYGVASGTPFPLDQLGGLVAMEQSAPELATFVDRVLAATGAAEVDLVAHSEGTVVSRYYLEFLGGAPKTSRLVSLTPLYRGTDLLALAQLRSLGTLLAPELVSLLEAVVAGPCGSCPQFLAGSAFLEDLNADGYTTAGVAYTNIVTRYDEVVIPYTSGMVAGAGVDNVVLQDRCVLDLGEHVAVAYNPVATRAVIEALDPSSPPAPSCTLVLPFLGSLRPAAA